MGFEEFGRASFASETKADEFVEYLKGGRIMGTRCENCGKLHFPPKLDCDSCLSDDVRWEELSGNASLLTYTSVNFELPDFKGQVPYILGIAELEEGVNVFANLDEEIDEDEVEIGMDLKLEPIEFSDGRVSYELKKG